MPFLNRVTSINKESILGTPPVPPTNSVSFQSSGSYAVTAANSALLFSGLSELCIEVYFRVNNFSAQTYAFLIAFPESNSTTNGGISLMVNNQLQVQVNFPFRFVEQSASNVISYNTWHHFCVQYKNNTMIMYVDGTEVRRRTQSGLLALMTNNRMAINSGYTSTFVESYYNGQIGDIRVSSTCLYVDGSNNLVSSFTRPSSALQSSASTRILVTTTSSSDILTDKSSNNITITKSGANIGYSTLTPYS